MNRADDVFVFLVGRTGVCHWARPDHARSICGLASKGSFKTVDERPVSLHPCGHCRRKVASIWGEDPLSFESAAASASPDASDLKFFVHVAGRAPTGEGLFNALRTLNELFRYGQVEIAVEANIGPGIESRGER